MTGAERDRYARERAADPYLVAHGAFRMARGASSELRREAQTTGHYHRGPSWTVERDGFTVRITAEVESTAPKSGDYYGEYVRASDPYGYANRPCEPTPMGLPGAHFKYATGQRDAYEYFFPPDVEDQFDYYRRNGASRAVARLLTARWVEGYVSDMQKLTYWDVTVTASREDVELGTASMRTTTLDRDDGELLDLVEDYDLIDEALDEARETLSALVETAGA